jgi:L-histidine N-alpha-methyltransferase
MPGASAGDAGLIGVDPGTTLEGPRAARPPGHPTAVRLRVDLHVDEPSRLRTLAEDVRRGLTAARKALPPKYFYDAAGSALFDRITALPEYYLTRAEARLLAEVGPALMREAAPRDLVEIGPGSAGKTRRLLDALDGAARDGGGPAVRYVPIDVDRGLLETVGRRLTAEYPFLHVHAIVGDFERHLGRVPPRVGPRLVLFLGSTIGNLEPVDRVRVLRDIRALLAPGDRLLLGVDLVKDTARLEAAYNDAAGVTREFNRNILHVVNRELGADFRPGAFRHLAFYDPAARRIEMHLVATAPQEVRLGALGVTIRLAAGESIWTESSYKFTRDDLAAALEAAGLRLAAWHAGADGEFGLAVAVPGPGTAGSGPPGSDAPA